MYDEPESPHSGACFRHKMIRNRMESPNEGRVLKICDEPEWPNEGVCQDVR